MCELTISVMPGDTLVYGVFWTIASIHKNRTGQVRGLTGEERAGATGSERCKKSTGSRKKGGREEARGLPGAGRRKEDGDGGKKQSGL